MKKGIFAMFILVASMAMVACTSSSTVKEGATNGDNQALQILEKKREFYKAQDKEKAKLEAEAKKAEEEARKAQEKAIEEAKKAEEEARKAEEKARLEALKILEKKRKAN